MTTIKNFNDSIQDLYDKEMEKIQFDTELKYLDLTLAMSISIAAISIFFILI